MPWVLAQALLRSVHQIRWVFHIEVHRVGRPQRKGLVSQDQTSDEGRNATQRTRIAGTVRGAKDRPKSASRKRTAALNQTARRASRVKEIGFTSRAKRQRAGGLACPQMLPRCRIPSRKLLQWGHRGAARLSRLQRDHSSGSQVLEAMLPYLREEFGNASGTHSYGREAKRAIEEARKRWPA